jgi:5-methylcytosine-specific restriction endonuclease McrA
MNGSVAVLLMSLALGGLFFVKPRGLLVTRRQRHRWRTRTTWATRNMAPRERNAYNRRKSKSGRISKRLRTRVLAADRHRCVACGATAASSGHPLEIDHGIPWIFGGLTWFPNLFTLCKPCNGTKGIYWEGPTKVYYRATWGKSSQPRAAAIRRMEERARRSPARLARAA